MGNKKSKEMHLVQVEITQVTFKMNILFEPNQNGATSTVSFKAQVCKMNHDPMNRFFQDKNKPPYKLENDTQFAFVCSQKVSSNVTKGF